MGFYAGKPTSSEEYRRITLTGKPSRLIPGSRHQSETPTRATVTLLLGSLSEREDIVPHGVLKDTVVRNMGAQLQKHGSPAVAGDATRPSELPQENQDVLKKLREMKLGAHIDHAHSISIGRLGGKYYRMIVIDGIDFVWPQTCQIRTNPEDLLHEFLTMSCVLIYCSLHTS